MKKIFNLDWNLFKIRSGKNPQEFFEFLCYLLFCKKYKQIEGIIRYKNQAGIETDPITTDSDVIGWQAKFYDCTLSSKKNELIKTISTTKKKYPNITKLLFYTNQEWGQGKTVGSTSKVKSDIEKFANNNNISIEWKTESFFQSLFVLEETQEFISPFFNKDDNTFSIIEDMEKDSNQIISGVENFIKFRNEKIKLNRNYMINELETKISKNNLVIITGGSGIGKTVLIKEFYEKQILKKIPIYLIRSSALNVNEISDLFKNKFYNIVEFHQIYKTKILIIDSLEKVFDFEKEDVLKDMLNYLIKENWKIILTIQKFSLERSKNLLEKIVNINEDAIFLKELELDNLKKLATKYNFSLPEDDKLLELITIPFYLDKFLNINSNKNINFFDFKEEIWKIKIRNIDFQGENFFLDIIYEKSKTKNFYIKSYEPLIKKFMKEGILKSDNYGIYIAHDIYEELGLKKLINRNFYESSNYIDFFEKIKEIDTKYKNFRNWLLEELELKKDKIYIFIEEIILDKDYYSLEIKDEILTVILLSEYSKDFFFNFKQKLIDNNYHMLKNISLILRKKCKKIDFEISNKFISLKPVGKGWEEFIKFIYENLQNPTLEEIEWLIETFYEWNQKNSRGISTKYSTLITLKWYKNIHEFYIKEEIENKFFNIISFGVQEIEKELSDIFNDIASNRYESGYFKIYYKYIIFILKNIAINSLLYKLFFNYVFEFMKIIWLIKKDLVLNKNNNPEMFGINSIWNHFYMPASAIQTPISLLLILQFHKTLEFIIEFINYSINIFAEKYDCQKIILYFDNRESKEQFIDSNLWKMYRGTGYNNYLLSSIHMSLEKGILDYIEIYNPNIEEIENILFNLLKKSNSASITAVVASIVMAYPNKTFTTAKVLFKTKELFEYDKTRLLDEQTAVMLSNLGGWNDKNKIFLEERQQSCKKEHRTETLLTLILSYQLFYEKEIQKEIHTILDSYYNSSENYIFKLQLKCYDSRLMQLEVVGKENGKYIYSCISKLSEEDQDAIKQHNQKIDSEIELSYLRLEHWARNRLDGNINQDYSEYNDFSKIKTDLNNLISKNYSIENPIAKKINTSTIIFVCCVLVKDYFNLLTNLEKKEYKNILLEIIDTYLSNTNSSTPQEEIKETMAILPDLIKKYPNEKNLINLKILLCLVHEKEYGHLKNTIKCINIIKSFSEENDCSYRRLLILNYLLFKSQYKNDEELLNFEYKNKLNINSIDFKKMKPEYLIIPLELLSGNIIFNEDKELVKSIIYHCLNISVNSNNYNIVKYNFPALFADLIKNNLQNSITDYLNPFLNEFFNLEIADEILNYIITIFIDNKDHQKFWEIWHFFKEPIVKFSIQKKTEYIDKLIKSYLFYNFNSNFQKTYSLELTLLIENNNIFFKEISKKLKGFSSILYSILLLIHNYNLYIEEGIYWISDIIEEKVILNKFEKKNIIFLLEIYMKKFIDSKNNQFKKDKRLETTTLKILDFLEENDSQLFHNLRIKMR